MTLQVGRALLSDPLNVRPMRRSMVNDQGTPTGSALPVQGTRQARRFMVEGRETGASAQSLVDALDAEAARRGSLYVLDDTGVIPAGYYLVADSDTDAPGGAPNRRPWRLQLVQDPEPWVQRQAEGEEVVGTVVSEVGADGGQYVKYTPTVATVILDPDAVVDTEPLDLPAGSYRVQVRVRRTTSGSVTWDLAVKNGVALVDSTGAVAMTKTNEWELLTLGTVDIPAADGGSNEYELTVNASSVEVHVDRVQFVKVAA